MLNEVLNIDSNLERSKQNSLSARLSKFLKMCFPCIALEVSMSRASVESQLLNRSSKVLESWDSLGLTGIAMEVCKLLATELKLPNYYFIPEDPFNVVIESGYALDRRYFFFSIEDRFGIHIDVDDWQKMCNEDWTILDFVRFLTSEISKRNAVHLKTNAP